MLFHDNSSAQLLLLLGQVTCVPRFLLHRGLRAPPRCVGPPPDDLGLEKDGGEERGVEVRRTPCFVRMVPRGPVREGGTGALSR